MDASIGFIGFGEVGYALSKGLRQAGWPRILAYDLDLENPDRRERVVRRATDADVSLCESVLDLARESTTVFSSVVSSVAIPVARHAAPHLRPGQIYIDLNSTSPMVKQEIAAVIGAAGGRFVEAAVMAAVPTHGHKVPMLLCGEAAAEVVALLSPYGMCLEDFGSEIGRGSAAKMFRSVVVKGLEALLVECTLAASRYGVTERVLDYVGAGYPGIDWNKLAHFLIGRTAIHAERRGHEMQEVADTLRALDIEPYMSEAAATRLLECAALGLKARFEDSPPASYDEVIRAIEEERKRSDRQTTEKEAKRARAYRNMQTAGARYVVEPVADLIPCLDDIQTRLRRGERP